MSKHYGIDAEPIEIKADGTASEFLKTLARRLASRIVWAVKVAFRFKVR